MKTFKLICLLLVALLFYNCKKNESDIKNYDVRGFAQKGPFQIGTTIIISELDINLNPTGRNFYTTVTDNNGNFTIPDVVLNSSFVELFADGFYFNERWGQVSNDKLVLKAIADLSDTSSVNINILTHIIRDRLIYLIQHEKIAYKEAKMQVQKEVLSIFNLNSNNSIGFEHLDISKKGELNNKLLAISSILQGNRDISNLTQLLTSISLDIKEDGILNSENLQTDIITSANFLDMGSIRKNLEKLYGDTIFNSFQLYVKKFEDSSSFQSKVNFEFPKSVENENNLFSFADNSIIEIDTIYIISQDFKNNIFWDFIITIERVSATGKIEFIENNLNNWNCNFNYTNPFNSIENTNTYQGVFLESFNLEQSSKIPIKIKVNGSGEMKIKISVDSKLLPDNGGHYQIVKYLRW
jgi:hypothetical protein